MSMVYLGFCDIMTINIRGWLKMKLVLKDIVSNNWFGEDINRIGTVNRFIDWWNSNIYHKIKEHDPIRVRKIIERYEKYEKLEQDYERLIVIETEFPELYSPQDEHLFVFLPDPCGDDLFRLSKFNSEGMILNHSVYRSKEDALRYAAKEGCTEERPGMMDSLINKPAFARSLVLYEAQKLKISLDQYLLSSTDKEVISLYQDRLTFLHNCINDGSLSM